MKIKLLTLSLSFLLISCGGSPSEDSKTTIMDVVQYLESVKFQGLDAEENCGKLRSYDPKAASMVGAIEGGRIRMENRVYCNMEVYRYSDEGAASLNVKSRLLKNSRCFAKGYFVFCKIDPEIMDDF